MRLKSEELSPRQREVRDRIIAGPRGAIIGPLHVWLKRPELAERAQLLGAYCRFETALTPSLSELAIVTVGAYWKSGFEWAAHAPLARAAGISDEVLNSVRVLSPNPPFERHTEKLVYEFSVSLLTQHKVAADEFERAIEVLGEPAIVDLVGILGYYNLACMTINAFEIEAPGTDPFILPSLSC